MKQEFKLAFKLSALDMFFVNYFTLGRNSHPHFSTSAAHLNRRKTDYDTCGQCQEEVLKKYRTANNFYKKWDPKHLKDLTDEEYQELLEDLEILKIRYDYVENTNEKIDHIAFCEIVELSKKPRRKGITK